MKTSSFINLKKIATRFFTKILYISTFGEICVLDPEFGIENSGSRIRNKHDGGSVTLDPRECTVYSGSRSCYGSQVRPRPDQGSIILKVWYVPIVFLPIGTGRYRTHKI
jgi:hypothetical protein